MKNTLKKSLAVLVGIMVLLVSVIGALSISADTDPYGTAADGMSQEKKNTFYKDATVTEKIENLDFSQGLKYWGPKNDRTGKASDYVKVTDGVLEFKGSAAYDGIRTTHFKLPYIAEGDKVCVIWRVKHTVAVTAQFYEVNPESIGEGKRVFSAPAYASASLTEPEVLITESSTAITSKDYYFYIQLQQSAAVTEAGQAYIEEIYIAKKNADGTYTDLSTGDKITATKGVGDKGIIEVEPAWAGTETEGITEFKGNGLNGKYMGEFINGDFQMGLKYWGSNATGSYTFLPKDIAELKTEGENKYVYLKGGPKGYYGLKSPVFTIPASQLAVGDRLVVVFDYKSTEDANSVQAALVQRFNSAGGENRLAQTFKADLVINEDWCTGYFGVKGEAAIQARSAGTADGYADSDVYAFQLSLEGKSEAATLSIDNLRIAKLVGDKIVALDGTTIHENVNTVIDNTATSGGDQGGAGTGSGDGAGDAGAGTGGGTTGGGSTGTGTGSGSSATTGESFPVAAVAVAGIAFAGAAVVLKKKVR